MVNHLPTKVIFLKAETLESKMVVAAIFYFICTAINQMHIFRENTLKWNIANKHNLVPIFWYSIKDGITYRK